MKNSILLLLGFGIALTGCSEKVKLQSADGKKSFVYECNNFRPQIETAADIAVLVQEAVKTLQDASKANAYLSVKEISEALDKTDWRELEKVVVSYRCTHK